MAQYILLLHEDPSNLGDISPERAQDIIQEYKDWRGKIASQGRLRGGEKLQETTGRILTRGADGTILDGPFSETKEVIGGFFVIEAESYDQAVELSRDCPHLVYGTRIEVREIEQIH